MAKNIFLVYLNNIKPFDFKFFKKKDNKDDILNNNCKLNISNYIN